MDDPNIDAKIRFMMRMAEEPLAMGWEALRKARADTHAHLTDKELFFAGAGYIFDAIVRGMTPGDQPTEQDMQMLEKIHKELATFHVHFNRKLQP